MMYRAALALAGALMVASAGQAAALTDENLDRLVALLEGAVDASDGIEVGRATITADGGQVIADEAACEFNLILNAEDPCQVTANRHLARLLSPGRPGRRLPSGKTQPAHDLWVIERTYNPNKAAAACHR